MQKLKELPSVKLYNKVGVLHRYFNKKYDRKNNQIKRQHYNYILSKAISMIAELKYNNSNKLTKQLVKLQLQNIVVKIEYAIKINNPKYLDQFVTLKNYIENNDNLKIIGIQNNDYPVKIEKHAFKNESMYTILSNCKISEKHSKYRTKSFDDFIKILEEVCHDTRFEMYDIVNNKNI